jgi:hypothetical protein
MKGQKRKKARQGGEERRVRGDDGTGKKGKDGREHRLGKQTTEDREGEIEEVRWEEDCQRRGCGTGKDGEDEIEGGRGRKRQTERERENVRRCINHPWSSIRVFVCGLLSLSIVGRRGENKKGWIDVDQ